MKRWALLLVLSLTSSVALGQSGNIDTELLRPNFAPRGWLGLAGADPGVQGSWRLGAVLQYEAAPLIVVRDGKEIAQVVHDRVGIHIGGMWVLRGGVGVGASLPLFFQSGNYSSFSVPKVALGDLRGDVSWRFLHREVIDLALNVMAFLPTSTRDALVGERLPRLEPGLALGVHQGPFQATAGFSLVARKGVRTGYDFDLGGELGWNLGARIWLPKGKVAIFAELESHLGFADLGKKRAGAPVDLRVGARMRPRGNLLLDVAVGMGLGSGYGTPQFRGLISGSFLRKAPEKKPAIIDLTESEEEEPAAVDAEEEEPEPPIEEEEPEVEELEREEEAALAELEGDRILHHPIEFEYDSASLLPSAYPILVEIMRILDANPDIGHLLIEGRASFEGDSEYNWDLSNRRAASVVRFLVNSGISMERLSYRGMGEVPSLDDDALRPEAERRVEFQVVEWIPWAYEEVPDWDATAPPVPWNYEQPEAVEIEDAELDSAPQPDSEDSDREESEDQELIPAQSVLDEAEHEEMVP